MRYGVCPHCKKEIEALIPLVCARCSKRFWVYKSEAIRGRKYCGRECSTNARKGGKYSKRKN